MHNYVCDRPHLAYLSGAIQKVRALQREGGGRPKVFEGVLGGGGVVNAQAYVRFSKNSY